MILETKIMSTIRGCEVEKVLSYRIDENGEESYLIEWLGYHEHNNSWEPREHMIECSRVLGAFWRRAQRRRLNGRSAWWDNEEWDNESNSTDGDSWRRCECESKEESESASEHSSQLGASPNYRRNSNASSASNHCGHEHHNHDNHSPDHYNHDDCNNHSPEQQKVEALSNTDADDAESEDSDSEIEYLGIRLPPNVGESYTPRPSFI